jgi:hypothetical protein
MEKFKESWHQFFFKGLGKFSEESGSELFFFERLYCCFNFIAHYISVKVVSILLVWFWMVMCLEIYPFLPAFPINLYIGFQNVPYNFLYFLGVCYFPFSFLILLTWVFFLIIFVRFARGLSIFFFSPFCFIDSL